MAQFITQKGWDNPLKAVDSYRNLEKILGADKIALPGKDAKPEDWGAVWNRLGRPEAPDKYVAPKIEGVEWKKDQLDGWFKEFHEAGVTQAAAERLLTKFGKETLTATTAQQESVEQRRTEALNTLKGEWRDKFDAQVDLAKRAFNSFADDKIKEFVVSNGLGDNPDFIKLMARIGGGMLEDNAQGRGNTGFAAGSPAAAQAEIAALKSDKDFWAKMDNSNAVGHKEAKDKWNYLHKMAYPQEKAAS